MNTEELQELERELVAKPFVTYSVVNHVFPWFNEVYIYSKIDYLSKDRLYRVRDGAILWPVRANEALSFAAFRDIVQHPYNREAVKNPAVRVVVEWSVEAIHWIAHDLDSKMDIVLRTGEWDVPANTVALPKARRDVLVRAGIAVQRALQERPRLLALMHLKVFKLKDGDRAISCRVCAYMGACAYDVRVATRGLPPLLPRIMAFRYDGTTCVKKSTALVHRMEGEPCVHHPEHCKVRKEVYQRVCNKVEEEWLKAVP
jgi:hypothetical protein